MASRKSYILVQRRGKGASRMASAVVTCPEGPPVMFLYDFYGSRRWRPPHQNLWLWDWTMKREIDCLIYSGQGKCLSTLFLLDEGTSLELFLLITLLWNVCPSPRKGRLLLHPWAWRDKIRAWRLSLSFATFLSLWETEDLCLLLWAPKPCLCPGALWTRSCRSKGVEQCLMLMATFSRLEE